MTNLFAENKDQIIDENFPFDYSDIVKVDITNVAYYVMNLPYDSFDTSQFVLKIPWEVAWFEYKFPHKIMVNGNIDKWEEIDRPTIGIMALPRGDYKNEYHFFQKHPVLGFDFIGRAITPLNKDYSPLKDKSVNQIYNYSSFAKNAGVEVAKTWFLEQLAIPFYASTFCHCNNVEYYEKSQPEALQKANIKRGKVPQETYRVLDIGGLQKQAKSESNSERGELQTALHICRGHFKTYTDENPLFGKHTGTYWWAMHKRGSEDNGKVDKDYNIKSPNE